MAPEHDRHPLNGRRVLIVEDDYLLAADLQQQFAAAGVEVLGPAPTVERALEVLDNTPVLDAAVLDVNLRGARSFPVADALAARGVPFLFATGYGDEALPLPYRQAVRHAKPVRFPELARALEALIVACPVKTHR